MDFLALLSISHLYPDFEERYVLMCLIDVPNLKEMEPWEGYFMWFKYSSKVVQRRRKMLRKLGNF